MTDLILLEYCAQQKCYTLWNTVLQHDPSVPCKSISSVAAKRSVSAKVLDQHSKCSMLISR